VKNKIVVRSRFASRGDEKNERREREREGGGNNIDVSGDLRALRAVDLRGVPLDSLVQPPSSGGGGGGLRRVYYHHRVHHIRSEFMRTAARFPRVIAPITAS